MKKTIFILAAAVFAWTNAMAQIMPDSTGTNPSAQKRRMEMVGGRSGGGLQRTLAVDEEGRLLVRPPEFEEILTDTLTIGTDTTGLALGGDYEALEIWTADTMTVVWYWLQGSAGDSVVVRQRPGDPFCYWGKTDTVTAMAEGSAVLATVIKKRLRKF